MNQTKYKRYLRLRHEIIGRVFLFNDVSDMRHGMDQLLDLMPPDFGSIWDRAKDLRFADPQLRDFEGGMRLICKPS